MSGETQSTPIKPPERLRQEELILMVWRILLLAATIWGGIYAWMGMFWPIAELERIAEQTPHDSLQLGVTIFIGAELAYYLYASWAFRQLREWGMGIWAAAFVVFLLNLKFAI